MADPETTEGSADQRYHPCADGLHICGVDDGEHHPCGPLFTMLNIELTPDAARAAFVRARQAFEVSNEDGEVVIDLLAAGKLQDSFWTRRKMIEAMQRSIGD